MSDQNVDVPSCIVKIAFQLHFHPGSKPDRIFILNDTFGIITESQMTSLETVADRCFSILTGKGFRLNKVKTGSCACPQGDRDIVSGVMNRESFVSWSLRHRETKRNCKSGVFFRLCNTARPHSIRFNKLIQHKQYPLDNWTIVVAGVRCVDENLPLPNLGTVDEIEEDYASSNLITVPDAIVQSARQKRNRERGNENAIRTMRPFLGPQASNIQDDALIGIIKQVSTKINSELFDIRSRSVADGRASSVYSETLQLWSKSLEAEKILFEIHNTIESFKEGGSSIGESLDSTPLPDIPFGF